ncbi:MAG: hypothetical protein WC080_02215 [Patescibacteria group bacterium]
MKNKTSISGTIALLLFVISLFFLIWGYRALLVLLIIYPIIFLITYRKKYPLWVSVIGMILSIVILAVGLFGIFVAL